MMIQTIRENQRVLMLSLCIISIVAVTYIAYNIAISFASGKDFIELLNGIELSNPAIYGTLVYVLLLIITIMVQQWIDVK